jgi:hypothetical protein
MEQTHKKKGHEMKLIKLENGLFRMKFETADVIFDATDTLAEAWYAYTQLQGFFAEIKEAKSEAREPKAKPGPKKAPAKSEAPDKPRRTPVMFELLAKHETLTPHEMLEKAGFKDDNVKFWSAIALRAVQSKKLKRRKLKDGGFTYSLKPSKG